jgi:DNA-binding NtrC family response regulator
MTETAPRPPSPTDRARKGRVLVVDDDRPLSDALCGLLAHAGYDAASAASGAEAVDVLRRLPTHLVLLDLRLGPESGLDVLGAIKKTRPEVSVIVITAVGTIETAVQAMQAGADNFVVKPLDPPRLLAVVAKGIEACGLRARALQLERIEDAPPSGLLAGTGPMADAVRLAETVASRDTTVLLIGETGTGKGLLARHIHKASERRRRPFIELNCAGLQRELTESELFGHEKGAFTGANERKLGLFEAAASGTLFLDEIGEMDSAVQAKLLKAIEDKTFRRIGGVAEIEVDVRLIAATHRDLEREVAEGRFRQDLYYRLSVFSIRLPPLREHPDDVAQLAAHFLAQYRQGSAGISPEAEAQLAAYSWPGNVRELRNVVERACILAGEAELVPAHLPPLKSPPAVPASAAATPLVETTTMRDAERTQIERALGAQGGNIKAAAKALGISRATLYRKAKKYDIPV